MSGNTNPNFQQPANLLVQDFSSLSQRAQDYILSLVPSNYFDIRDYGAVVDGTTNDGAAVNLAIAAAFAAGGGVIFFPAGTTKIATQLALQSPGVDCDIIFQGVSGASRIAPVMSGIDHLVRAGNLNRLVFQDLCFIGQSSAGSSTAARESYSNMFHIDAVYGCLFNRCSFFGLYVEAEALIYANSTACIIRDCFFWSCMTLGRGVVYGTGDLRLLDVNNCFFNDYGTYNGIYYDKISKVGNVYTWIQTTALNELTTAVGTAQVAIRNCRFDENTQTGLLNLVGNADRSLLLENNSCNSGFGLVRTADIGTWRKVTLNNNYFGYVTNTTETEAIRFRTIDQLEINGHLNEYASKYITLGAGMRRAKFRNSDFNAVGGTYAATQGINNTGTCIVDCDNYIPTTASAAALRPLGITTVVSGTTNITSITSTDFKPNDVLTLIFADVLTVTDGSNLKLAGNFVTTADDILVLVYDGNNWFERSRSIN